jgi:hypothetical protein
MLQDIVGTVCGSDMLIKVPPEIQGDHLDD